MDKNQTKSPISFFIKRSDPWFSLSDIAKYAILLGISYDAAKTRINKQVDFILNNKIGKRNAG